MARRFEDEKGEEEEEEEENERFAKEGGIIRLVSISPWRETFIGIVAPDVNRKRKRMDENRLESWAEKARSRFEERRFHCP